MSDQFQRLKALRERFGTAMDSMDADIAAIARLSMVPAGMAGEVIGIYKDARSLIAGVDAEARSLKCGVSPCVCDIPQILAATEHLWNATASLLEARAGRIARCRRTLIGEHLH